MKEVDNLGEKDDGESEGKYWEGLGTIGESSDKLANGVDGEGVAGPSNGLGDAASFLGAGKIEEMVVGSRVAGRGGGGIALASRPQRHRDDNTV